MTGAETKRRVNLWLCFLLAVNFLFWFGSSDVFSKWGGVPPVPDKQGALMMTLGDPELSFRSGAITLQNLGDTGGQTTPLKEYDYARLGKWFSLLDLLDPASDHVPFVAAYYFGATRVPSDVRVVVDYLGRVGENPAGAKWRWLAHAVYLAQHRLSDLDLALDLAYRLSKLRLLSGDLPMWAQQMPAFVLKARGDKEDARAIMQNLLMSKDSLDQKEVNYMLGYLTDELGVPKEDVDRLQKMRGVE